ncbi:LPS-assembly protein LptD [Roseovarius sp. A-2]|uniref:LptA/OstA family protein n=1 Tax=Roseovarius sp. A-2 TaxID=1570360 RepID=UPI0009B56F5B|nr:LptA/OstA family protein [Roseovarius sp. A-2]GAW33339.1 LPS-assembly protein LptD [Roseovarius sp. A-2]
MVFSGGNLRRVAGLLLAACLCLGGDGLVMRATAQEADGAEEPRGTRLAFGSIKVSADMPLEVVSDTLSMDQNVDIAIFSGSVVVDHGELQLKAGTVQVEYGNAEEGGAANGIIRVIAEGDVLMQSPDETAEGDRAVYTIATSEIVVTGDVVVTQGINRVTGERMIVDLEAGTAVMVGRVRTFIDPGATGDEDPDPGSAETDAETGQ